MGILRSLSKIEKKKSWNLHVANIQQDENYYLWFENFSITFKNSLHKKAKPQYTLH